MGDPRRETSTASAAAAAGAGWLTRNLKVVSGVSFLQDMASELLYPILPIFLTVTLGAVPAENGVWAAQAACSYSRRMPPSRSRRWMVSRARRSGSVIGSRSGFRGRALAMP
jgi:hypothetical protein